eukprot:CAMPEP_0168379898 /NCGR_PEP_ID=MMETSP0228-20121227/12081_1 /TAXON_ID=133427 /ORGANISM="Protoceratium reticulatum, Strain CCCM 535 (=CCMP 1889)" /LENGTH=155 /DNA_ID=CAMNT_0008392945 /DNA_START=56 /DNA_END=520 /DNA_ORIENTATION=+
MAAIREVVDEKVFAALDRDGDGLLKAADLEAALACAGHEAKAETLAALAGEGLGLEALRGLVVEHGEGVGDKEVVALALGLCCGPGASEAAGLVGPEALRAGLAKLGLSSTSDEAKELLREFDQDGDGLLSRAEFAALMGAEPLPVTVTLVLVLG